jgi:hypothetical protein
MKTKVRVTLLIAGLLLLPVLGGAVVYWFEMLTESSDAGDGRIIVNSPSVYTRQRLVNDRLSQSAWLQDQLKVTTDALLRFQAIDEVRHTSDQRTLNISAAFSAETGKPGGPEAKGGAAPAAESVSPSSGLSSTKPDSESVPSPDLYHVEPTTADLFRAMNTYREEVRSEMMQTLLDDRHDILGNTIYRLAIDATVLAGLKADKLALINVVLHYSADDHRPDYDVLYDDWLRYVQRIVNGSVDGLAKSFPGRSLDPRVRVMLPYFLVGEVCKSIELANSRAPTEERCDVWSTESTDSVDLARRLLDSYVSQYLEYRQEIIKQRFERNLKTAAEGNHLKPADFIYAFDFASRACDPGADPTYVQLINGIRTTYVQAIGGQKVPVECPLFTLPDEGLVAGVTLYDYVATHFSAFADLIADQQIGGDPKAIAGKLLTVSVTSNCSIKYHTLCITPDLTQAQFGCVAAEYIVWSLNAFGNPRARQDERIGTFLDLRRVGRQFKKCSLLVAALMRTDARAQDIGKPNPGPVAPQILIERLNGSSEVYAYSVTPKTLSQRVSSTVDIRDALQLLLSAKAGIAMGDAATISNQIKKHAEDLQTVQQHAIVVGFGRSRGVRSSEPPYEANFGWAIAPHLGANGEQEQVDGQYGLAAVISVPGWWRSINLKIKTCWIRRKDLQISLDKAEDVCLGGTVQEQEDIVRLPGVVSDISRKLGFEVIQEPYLSQDQIVLQSLDVGRRGDILLKGDRLWRSTEVTLGSQQADRINVLPDMEGIVAHFDCVNAQFGLGNDNRGPISVPVIVWTSEGRAQPDDDNTVRLAVPKEFTPCPEPRTKPVAEQPRNPVLPPGTSPGQAVEQPLIVSPGPTAQSSKKGADGPVRAP